MLRKRKVLHLLSQWSSLCTDLLQDDEHAKLFLKVQEGKNGTFFGSKEKLKLLEPIWISICNLMRMKKTQDYHWLRIIMKCPHTFLLSYITLHCKEKHFLLGIFAVASSNDVLRFLNPKAK